MNRLKILLVVCALACVTVPAAAGDPRPTVADLSFLEGRWTGENDGELYEEIWSAPRAGSVMGVYREMKGDRTTFYELLVVQESGGRLMLRLKHFTETLVGWEEKDKAVDLPVVRFAKDEVVFESDDKNRMTRLTYRRVSPTALVAVLERKRDDKLLTNEFRYALAK